MIRSEAGERAAQGFFWLAVVGLAAAGAHYALTKSMQHDVAYYVNAVERLLDGARLYRDLIDVNVPTIYWVTAVPVGAARQLGVPATVGFNVFVLLLAALSAAAVFHSARQGAGHSGWLPEILTGLLLLWFLVLVRHDFGQREHLATILLAPYAVIRAGAGPGRPGTPLRILIGIGAGVGMSLKPYFVLILAGMEGALLLRRGWRAWAPSWEAAALFATAGGCAAATLLLAPEYLETVVPLARATYHGFEWPILDIIGSMGMRRRLLLASGLLAIVLAWRLDQRSGDLALLFSGGGIGALAAFLLQSKGWVYQLYPALTFSCVAFVIAIAGDLRARLAGRARRVAVAVVGTLVAIGVAGALLELSRAYRADRALREQSAPVLAALRDHAQGGPALFVSLDVDYTFPGVNYAGAAYPYRWHHLLPLPGLYRDFVPGPGHLFRTPDEMGPIERDFFESFVADALAHRPRIVLVDRRRPVRPGLSPELDLLAYFCQSARFAELMGGFDWLGRRGTYDVLVPRAGAPASPGPCDAPRPQSPVASNS